MNGWVVLVKFHKVNEKFLSN